MEGAHGGVGEGTTTRSRVIREEGTGILVKGCMYTRHIGVFGRAAHPSHPMVALSLLAIGLTMTRRDALPWGANETLR